MIQSATETVQEIQALISANTPVIWALTHEENRFIEDLHNFVLKSNSIQTHVWSLTQGLVPLHRYVNGVKNEETKAPTAVLDAINEMRKPEDSTHQLFILRDFNMVMQEPVIRRIRDLYNVFADSNKTLLIISPELTHNSSQGHRNGVPNNLEKQIVIVRYALPSLEEVEQMIRGIIDQCRQDVIAYKLSTDTKLEYEEQDYRDAANALKGLSLIEVENSIAACLNRQRKLDPYYLLEDKKQMIYRSQILEYIDTSGMSLESVGGLDNIKNYIERYARASSKEAKAFGVEPLRGVIFTGVPGVGKSLTAKVVSRVWKIPCVRLDIGKVMGSLVGSSEANMRSVIATAESLAPCVLWIDELEKALSGTGASGHTDGGTTSRTFGTLLTAMQEGLQDVTIVATANNIEALPPELIRRFDEVFFVDLPGPDERWDIFKIHLEKRGRDPSKYNKHRKELVDVSYNYTGAEIEKAIKDAIARAFYTGAKDLEIVHLKEALTETRPIAVVQKEQIIRMQKWALDHARYASSYSEELNRSKADDIRKQADELSEQLGELSSRRKINIKN